MKMVTLGEVAVWGSGGTPKRGVPEFFGTGVPWLSIADLNDGIVNSARESLTTFGVANSSAKVVPAGSIFVAMYGSIGKLGVAGAEMCTSQAIAFAKPRRDRINDRYLFHFLLSERPKLQAMGRGGTQMNIGQADLKAWPIPLPPLDEQRRIAAILDHADSLRAKRRQVLAHLDGFINARYSELFNRGTFPSMPMDLLVSEQRIGLDRRSADQGSDRAWEYVKMDAISRAGRLDLRSLNRVNASDQEAEKYALYDGDLVFNTRNTRELVGKSAVYRGPKRLYNNNIMRLRFHTSVLSDYVNQYLWSWDGQKQLESRKSGTTSVCAIYAKSLATLEIPVAPIELQREFSALVKEVAVQRERVERALMTDGELFASLQARAFRGEL